jgi:hypothetical protein
MDRDAESFVELRVSVDKRVPIIALNGIQMPEKQSMCRGTVLKLLQ